MFWSGYNQLNGKHNRKVLRNSNYITRHKNVNAGRNDEETNVPNNNQTKKIAATFKWNILHKIYKYLCRKQFNSVRKFIPTNSSLAYVNNI